MQCGLLIDLEASAAKSAKLYVILDSLAVSCSCDTFFFLLASEIRSYDFDVGRCFFCRHRKFSALRSLIKNK